MLLWTHDQTQATQDPRTAVTGDDPVGQTRTDPGNRDQRLGPQVTNEMGDRLDLAARTADAEKLRRIVDKANATLTRLYGAKPLPDEDLPGALADQYVEAGLDREAAEYLARDIAARLPARGERETAGPLTEHVAGLGKRLDEEMIKAISDTYVRAGVDREVADRAAREIARRLPTARTDHDGLAPSAEGIRDARHLDIDRATTEHWDQKAGLTTPQDRAANARAARRRNADNRMAEELRTRGWVVVAPEGITEQRWEYGVQTKDERNPRPRDSHETAVETASRWRKGGTEAKAVRRRMGRVMGGMVVMDWEEIQ